MPYLEKEAGAMPSSLRAWDKGRGMAPPLLSSMSSIPSGKSGDPADPYSRRRAVLRARGAASKVRRKAGSSAQP